MAILEECGNVTRLKPEGLHADYCVGQLFQSASRHVLEIWLHVYCAYFLSTRALLSSTRTEHGILFCPEGLSAAGLPGRKEGVTVEVPGTADAVTDK